MSSHVTQSAVSIAPPGVRPTFPDIVDWLHIKITDAEKALKFREDGAASWRSGTNAEWNAAAAMHPSTTGRHISKKDRLKLAAIDDRVAVKLRHELLMFRATLDAVGPRGS